MNFSDLSYVLITPARNEEEYIEKTINSVVSQSMLPKKWVIVSDGSTDRTEAIVKDYLDNYTWMELIVLPAHRDRQFAAKVSAFNAGYQRLKEISYNVIGNLDADISFENDYFEFLMEKFAEIHKLGVAGTPFVEEGTHYDYRFTNIEHVSGACQMFRRECYENIGGYIPIKGGGIDWVAVTTARMKGWKTRTFTEKKCYHHKKMGTGNTSALMSHFKHGQKDYYLGGHPLWEIFRTIYQMSKKPFFLGGLFLFVGYSWALITKAERPIPMDIIKFHRSEQMQRLNNAINKIFKK